MHARVKVSDPRIFLIYVKQVSTGEIILHVKNKVKHLLNSPILFRREYMRNWRGKKIRSSSQELKG